MIDREFEMEGTAHIAGQGEFIHPNQPLKHRFIWIMKSNDSSKHRSRRLLVWGGLLVVGGALLLLSFAGPGGKENALPSPLELVGYMAGAILSFVAFSFLILEVGRLVIGRFLQSRKQS